MRVVLPDNEFYHPLTIRAEELSARYNVAMRRSAEYDCARLLLNNTADLALITPLGYGSGVLRSDLRIVPTNACMLRGWTGVGSMYFHQDLDEVTSISSPTPRDFLVICAQMLLDEQYNISAPIREQQGSLDELLKQSSTVLKWREDSDVIEGMDVSEEWDISFGYPLAMAMWVCRDDFVLDAGSEVQQRQEMIQRYTAECAALNLSITEDRWESHEVAHTERRHGQIDWTWSEQFEESLLQMVQLLYYRQLISEIPAIKVLGRD